MTTDLEAAKSKVCELAEEIQTNRSNIGDLQAEIDELEEEISEKESQIFQVLKANNVETLTVSDVFTYTASITGNSVYVHRTFDHPNN